MRYHVIVRDWNNNDGLIVFFFSIFERFFVHGIEKFFIFLFLSFLLSSIFLLSLFHVCRIRACCETIVVKHLPPLWVLDRAERTRVIFN